MFTGVGGQQAFRTEPKNVTVNAGAKVVLKCQVLRASGVVQWAKDGLLLGPQRSIPGFPRYSMIGNEEAGQYHLQIEKAELKDDAPYECQVGQSESSRAIISHKVWINVQIPPSKPFFEVEMEKPWVAGRKYTVTCVAPDAKPEAEIILYKDGVELTDIESVTTKGSEEKLLNTHANVAYVSVDSSPPPTLRWLLPLLAESVSKSLIKVLYSHRDVAVTALSSDNARKLVCRARNPALSRGLETSLTMRVLFPPQAPFIQGLERNEVRAGRTLKLVCVSEGGNPLATLQWSKDGAVLSTSWEEDTEARRSSSLLYLQVTPDDNQAVLRCDSVNLVSPATLSFSRQLTVHLSHTRDTRLARQFCRPSTRVVPSAHVPALCSPPGIPELHLFAYSYFEPKVVKVLGSFDAVEGTVVDLCCFTSSSNPPVQIRWWLGFRELNTTDVIAEGDNGGMTTMSNLTHRVSREENGLPLTCEAFNKGTRFSKSESNILNVFYPPLKVWLDAPPQNVPLRSGSTVRLICFSSGGNPTGQLTWQDKNGKAVPNAQKQVTSDKGVSRELILVLQPSDNLKIYRCSASNEAQKPILAETKLMVQFPAVSVKIIARQKELRRGQTLSLECLSGSSNPRANISWSIGPLR
ncbi:nephrin [Aplochiton taeniatus]